MVNTTTYLGLLYDVYINTDELMAYDNLAPKDTKINGWNNYRSLWETFINDSSSNQEITRFDIDRIETSGDLGWSGVTMRFRAKNKGKDFYSSQHSGASSIGTKMYAL